MSDDPSISKVEPLALGIEVELGLMAVWVGLQALFGSITGSKLANKSPH